VPTRVAAATIAAQVGLFEGSSSERRDLPG